MSAAALAAPGAGGDFGSLADTYLVPDAGFAPEDGTSGADVIKKRLKRPNTQVEQRQIQGRNLDLDVIEQALRAAWIGDMRRFTDLTRETIDFDPHLASAVGKRVGATATFERSFPPADFPGCDPNLAKTIAEEVQRQFEDLPAFDASIQQLAWGLFDGRACLEKVWQPQAGPVRWKLDRLDWIHPRRLGFGRDRELRIVDAPNFTTFYSPAGDVVREKELKFCAFMPQLFGDYPEREGLAARALYWSFFKRFGARERMVLIELFGKPWRWVEVENSDEEIANEAWEGAIDVVENIPGNSWGVLPRGMKMEIQQEDARGAEAHARLIEDCDKQMSKLILGQTGTMEATAAGLNSNTTAVLRDEQIMIHVADAERLGFALRSGIAESIVVLNYGVDARRYTPRVKLTVPIDDRLADIQRAKAALELGIALAVADAYELTGFRAPEDDEPRLQIDLPAGADPSSQSPRIVLKQSPVEQAAAKQAADRAAQAQQVGQQQPADRALALNASDLAQVVTVNEARASAGLGPLQLPTGGNDPAGYLTISAYEAKQTEGGGGGGGFGAPPAATPPPTPAAPPAAGPAPPTGAKPANGGPTPPAAAPEPPGAGGKAPTPAKPAAGPPVAAGGTPPRGGVELAIQQREGRFYVVVGDGVAAGDYDTLEQAQARERQLEVLGQAAALVEGEPAYGMPWVGELSRQLGDERAGVVLGALGRAVRAEPAAVRLDRQPDTTFGSPEDIIDRGVREGARAMQAMGEHLFAATDGLRTAPEIFQALQRRHAEDMDLAPLARILQRRTFTGVMLGALDHAFEREHGTLIALPKYGTKAWRKHVLPFLLAAEDDAKKAGEAAGGAAGVLPPAPRFARMPFDAAERFFKDKQVLSKAAFEQLDAGAKRRAFTVARLESQNLLELAHAELGRQIAEGADLRDFRKSAVTRLTDAGWVPASSSHVETVFRTNVTQAHSVGRLKDMTQPAVMRARPYWQIRGVDDSRARHTHKAVHGWTLPASDPFFERAFPGNFGYNCRCRATSLSERQLKARGITARNGASIANLPDPGFTGSGMGSLLAEYS